MWSATSAAKPLSGHLPACAGDVMVCGPRGHFNILDLPAVAAPQALQAGSLLNIQYSRFHAVLGHPPYGQPRNSVLGPGTSAEFHGRGNPLFSAFSAPLRDVVVQLSFRGSPCLQISVVQ